MPYLQFLTHPEGEVFEVKKDLILIGRSEKSDLVLKEETVSREHARLRRSGKGYVLEDCGSRHGIYLNRVRLGKPTELRDQDRVAICGAILKFVDAEAPVHDPMAETKIPPTAAGKRTEDQAGDGAGAATVEKDGGTRGLGALAAESSEEDSRTLIMSTQTAMPEILAETGVDSGIKLRAVMEIIRCLRTAVHADELFPRVLEGLFRIFPQAKQGTILLLGLDGALSPRTSRTRSGDPVGAPRISQTIVREAMEKRQAFLSADALSDSQFMASYSISQFGIRSVMCVPLLSQDAKPLGILHLHAEEGGKPFGQEDLDVLVSVASTVSMALENLRLHEDLVQKERLQRELELARDIQRRFLPSGYPEAPGYRFRAEYRAALSVGGDYYGFVELPRGRLAIAVGDVSGKGMPAALLMARISSDIRYALSLVPDPAAALASMNRALIETEIESRFMTLVLMILDKEQHTLTVANAGHLPPLLRQPDGRVEEIGKGRAGMPLNVHPDPNYQYQTATVPIYPGAAVAAFTDGVVESQNPQGEFFGAERLQRLVAGLPADAEAMGKGILEAAVQFAAGRSQHDDIALVVFQRAR